MDCYKHVVKYYETDKMGITHHSNYIRFMEEARVDFLKKIGCDYAKLEENGIVSPVVSVECKYKATTTFEDELSIFVYIEEFKGVKLKFKYLIKKVDGTVAVEACSQHCFLDCKGKPINIKKDLPNIYEKLAANINEI